MGGYVVSMATTRRQSYGMCQYHLIKHFPNFLQAEPLIATRVVIQSLNFFIIRAYTREDSVETFNFRGGSAYLLEDGSDSWDKREILSEPIEMAEALFKFIVELAVSEDSLLDSLLEVFRDHVRVAFFWKRLLKTGAQFPEVFASRLFELCVAKPIQMSSDVLYALCTFLKFAATQFAPEQQLEIEEKHFGTSCRR